MPFFDLAHNRALSKPIERLDREKTCPPAQGDPHSDRPCGAGVVSREFYSTGVVGGRMALRACQPTSPGELTGIGSLRPHIASDGTQTGENLRVLMCENKS